MNTLVKSWLAGFAALFAVSMAWYLPMASRYDVWEAGFQREQENGPVILIGLALLSFVIAYLHPRVYEGGSHVAAGARLGATIALVFGAMLLVLYGAWAVNGVGLAADFVANLIALSAAGAAIGFMHEKATSSAPDTA